jgi:hypothetical protein
VREVRDAADKVLRGRAPASGPDDEADLGDDEVDDLLGEDEAVDE